MGRWKGKERKGKASKSDGWWRGRTVDGVKGILDSANRLNVQLPGY